MELRKLKFEKSLLGRRPRDNRQLQNRPRKSKSSVGGSWRRTRLIFGGEYCSASVAVHYRNSSLGLRVSFQAG
jgi:hypothetical protein